MRLKRKKRIVKLEPKKKEKLKIEKCLSWPDQDTLQDQFEVVQ